MVTGFPGAKRTCDVRLDMKAGDVEAHMHVSGSLTLEDL